MMGGINCQSVVFYCFVVVLSYDTGGTAQSQVALSEVAGKIADNGEFLGVVVVQLGLGVGVRGNETRYVRILFSGPE